MENERRLYQVYYKNVRDTQVYTGSDEQWNNLSSEENESLWRCIQQDMLVDIVFARDEEDAVLIVAKNEDCHPDALYAIEHTLDVISDCKASPTKSARISAVPSGGDDEFGIKILFPDGTKIFVGQSTATGKKIIKEM